MRGVSWPPALVTLQVGVILVVGQRLWQIAFDRRVEVDPAFVNQLHDHVTEGGLGQRRAVHHGVRCERQLLLAVAPAIGADVDDASLVDHGEREPDHVLLLHQAAHFGVHQAR
jgi:hypothetical protein